MPTLLYRSLATGAILDSQVFGSTLGPPAASKYRWGAATAGGPDVKQRFVFYNLHDRIEVHRRRQISADATAWYSPPGGGGGNVGTFGFSLAEDRVFADTPIEAALPANHWTAPNTWATPPVTLTAHGSMESQTFQSWNALYDDEPDPDDGEPGQSPPAGLSILGQDVHVDGGAWLLAAYAPKTIGRPHGDETLEPGEIWIADPAFLDAIRRLGYSNPAAAGAVVMPEMLGHAQLRALATDLRSRLKRGEAALKSLEKQLGTKAKG